MSERYKIKPIKIGEKHNKWTVISNPFKKGEKYYVRAKCECGVEKDVIKNSLQNNKTKSCGCYTVETNKLNNKGKTPSNIKSLEEVATNSIYLDYKNNAKKRNLTFNINKDDFISLTKQKCKYCGSNPTNKINIKGKDSYYYNGLDRVDNSIGYEISNVVPCCKTCNTMKMASNIPNFFEHLNKIIKNNQVKPGIREDKLDSYYARAIEIAKNSPDEQTKVGALLINIDSGAVMAEGYNGFVRGAPDDRLPKTRPEKYEYMIHAETNLICNAIRHGVKTDGCVIFCTLSPCKSCLRMLYQSGIKYIYFKDTYKDLVCSANMQDLDFKIEQIGNYSKIIFK